jgi:hypothetical protein
VVGDLVDVERHRPGAAVVGDLVDVERVSRRLATRSTTGVRA